VSTPSSSYPELVEARHEKSARRLVLTWDDGHVSAFPIDYLRSWCPCAACQGHEPTAKYLDLTDQELVLVEGVGNYALALNWGDGHSTGIYTYERLRNWEPKTS